MANLSFIKDLPKLAPLPEFNFWILAEDWTYGEYTVPAGFVTDLDSIPHVPGLYLAVKGRARYSALLHDYLYTGTLVSRHEADLIFKKAMLDEHVPPWMANAMFHAVRAFGGKRYGQVKRKEDDVRRILSKLAKDEGQLQ